MDEAVIKTQEEFWAALKTKNRSLFEQVLTNDFVALSPSAPNQNREAFIDALVSFPAEVLEVTGERLQVHLVNDVAVLSGIQRTQVRLRNGAPILDSLVITNVFRKDGDRWRMALAHPVEACLDS